MRDQPVDFEARKELIKNLQVGEKVTVKGKEYTFERVDNPHFPYWIILKSAEGEVETLPIEDVGESIRASVGTVLKPESPQSFGAYKKHHGELDASQYAAVMSCRWSEEDYAAAMGTLIRARMGLPDHSTVEMAARLVGTLKGNDMTKHPMWLLTEAMLLLGRF